MAEGGGGGLGGDGLDGGADEAVEAGVEGPGGGGRLGLLDLVLLLEGVDAVLALDVRLTVPDAVYTGVDGVGDLLPVLLTEVASVEEEITVAPRLD